MVEDFLMAENMGSDYPKLRAVEAYPVKIQGRSSICLRDPEGLAEGAVMVPPELFYIIAMFDGRHSIPDISLAYTRQFGTVIPSDRIREIINQLDEALFLEGNRVSKLRQQALDGYRRAPVRPAAHAGGSYEADPDKLRAQMDAFFEAPSGPGRPEPNGRAGTVRGGIAPHIDLRIGGPCLAWAYKEIIELSNAELFIVFGTGHASRNSIYTLTRKDYDTPFGVVRTDQRFIDALSKRCTADLFVEEIVHRSEHSVEFQAIFLKYLYPEKEVSFVPILCGSFHEMIAREEPPMENRIVRDFIKGLRETIEEDGRSICMISGVDFAHVGAKFGDQGPITPDFLESVASEDRERIEAIETLDADGFFKTIQRDGDRRRICGTSSIYTMLQVMNASEGRLLNYDRTVDPQTDSAVTYASMAFY